MFKGEDLQMFGLKLNKFNIFKLVIFTHLEVAGSGNETQLQVDGNLI